MPNTAVVISGLELQADWIQPSNTGDTGGGSTKPNGTFVMQPATPYKAAVAAVAEVTAVAAVAEVIGVAAVAAEPAVAATPAVFSAAGNYAYNNGYWYRLIPGAWDAMTYFKYNLAFMLPTAADLAASQAVEFELQQSVGGHIYNMAWQADLSGSKVWRTFDYNTSQWIATEIPVSITPGAWTTVEAVFLRSIDLTLTHVSLSLNGVVYPVNVTKAATAKVGSDYVHCAFQLDSGSPAAPYTCKVRDVDVTMLQTTL